jgi:hypothetical protein
MISLAAADRCDMLVDDGAGNYGWADSANSQAVGMYINYEFTALWDVLINSNEDYCVFRKLIDVVPGFEDYPLPEDFYKFRKVFPILSGKRGSALKKFNLEELGAADSLAALLTSPIEDTRYRINGMRLWLHPVPTSAAQLELWYVPQFDIIHNSFDLVPAQFPLGWEEYVIEGVAARMLEKEESDATAQRTRQKEILQRILIMTEDRDIGSPHQMQDVEGYLDS